MRLVRTVAIIAVALVMIGGALAYFNRGAVFFMVASMTGPSGAFVADQQAPAPDYANPANWAALPQTQDPADMTPEGVAARTAPAPADVFFIHPTGFIAARTWTSPMDPNSATEDNTRWMMANQASVFNGCCDVYAPRYREAAIHVFFGDAARRDAVLGFAYQDVERAFDYFLEHFSNGRPFVIASHS